MAESTIKDDGAESAYFNANPRPFYLGEHVRQAQTFIAKQNAVGRRVVLVTSGGTTVPLENQTVRFIDNFSESYEGCHSETS